MNRYVRVERTVAAVLANISATLLALIVMLFVCEIGLRYVLNSPTKWSNDVVGFITPAMIFLALPEVTRRGQHIAITILVEIVGEERSTPWSRVLAAMSSAVTALAFWITASTTLKQFEKGILSNTVIPVSKWALMAPIAAGFLAMAIIFMATALGVRRDRGMA